MVLGILLTFQQPGHKLQNLSNYYATAFISASHLHLLNDVSLHNISLVTDWFIATALYETLLISSTVVTKEKKESKMILKKSNRIFRKACRNTCMHLYKRNQIGGDWYQLAWS